MTLGLHIPPDDAFEKDVILPLVVLTDQLVKMK